MGIHVMKIIQIVVALLFCLAGASAARADGPDLPWGGPPGTPCGGIYSGFYVGGALGGGSMRSKVSGDLGTLTDNDKGFTIGEYSGYNVQCGNALIGIESEFSYFGAQTDLGCDGCGPSFSSSMNWFSALRGRVGVVADYNILLFATGGLAYSNVDHKFSDPFAPDGPFSQHNDDVELGWTVGGGFEIFLRDHWTFRADAAFVDLGTDHETFTFSDCGAPGATCQVRETFEDSFWVTRIGLTYLFSAVAGPLVPEFAPEYGPVK
jgi:outer membrane immunogenic protein